MNSCSLRERICPRTSRAVPDQPNMVSIPIRAYILLSAGTPHVSSMDEASIRMGKDGRQLKISTIRMMTWSTHLPK